MTNKHLPLAAILATLSVCACQPTNQPAPGDSAAPVAEQAATTAEAAPAPAGHPLEQMNVQLIAGSAQMAAVAVNCKFGTPAQALDARRQARGKLVDKGVDGAEFDRVYDAAYAAAMQKWDNASAGEREQGCSTVRNATAQAARDLPSSEELQRMEAEMQDKLEALKKHLPAQ